MIMTLGGRKFILACVFTLFASGFLAGGLINSTQWIDLAKWIMGGYIAGNFGASLAANLKKPQ